MFSYFLPAAALAIAGAVGPSAIGVIILTLTKLRRREDRRVFLVRSSAYAAGAGLAVLSAGFVLFLTVNALYPLAQNWFYLAGGLIVLGAGLVEFKDFFWYGRWFSLAIPVQLVRIIETKAAGVKDGPGAAFGLGFLSTLLLLPAAGAPLLAVTLILKGSGADYKTALLILAGYSLISLLPLKIIAYLTVQGLNLKRIEAWRLQHRRSLRLIIGILLIAAGIWIITASGGAYG